MKSDVHMRGCLLKATNFYECNRTYQMPIYYDRLGNYDTEHYTLFDLAENSDKQMPQKSSLPGRMSIILRETKQFYANSVAVISVPDYYGIKPKLYGLMGCVDVAKMELIA